MKMLNLFATFVSTMMYFGSLSSVNPLECLSMGNQEYKVRTEIVNVNSNEPLIYPFTIMTNIFSVSCKKQQKLLIY